MAVFQVNCICKKRQEDGFGPKAVIVIYIHTHTHTHTHVYMCVCVCDYLLLTFHFVLGYTAAAAAKSLQSYPTLCDPINGSHQASPSLGFSRQENWNGLPFPSPFHESEK